jgi:D-alanyl-D-alanine dipeptidase
MPRWLALAAAAALPWVARGAEGTKTPTPAKTPADAGLVNATTLVPDLVVDLRYATADNFLKKKVYPDGARCLLREESAQRLARAAEALRRQGFRLKVYDCYRPLSVQWEMWKVFPKPGYVADPRTGSNHNRGGAVDLTLVTLDGKEVEMPTPFDTFSPAAHHGYAGGSAASRKHREVLRAAMVAQGFTPNRMEWWHYDLPQPTRYPVLDVPFTGEGPKR